MQRWPGRNQRLDDADIVQNARRGGIADDCLDVFSGDPIDNRPHGITRGWRVDQVYLVSILDCDTGGVSQPLGVI